MDSFAPHILLGWGGALCFGMPALIFLALGRRGPARIFGFLSVACGIGLVGFLSAGPGTTGAILLDPMYVIFYLLPIVLGCFACVLPPKRIPSRIIDSLCPKCGYNLFGNKSGICPECGEDRIVVFECPSCRVILTHPLLPLPKSQTITHQDQQPAVPQGYFALADEDFQSQCADCTIVNINDLVGPYYHPEKSRHIGCCGRSETEKPTLICMNGHAIGFELSDCWTPLAALLLPSVQSTHMVER